MPAPRLACAASPLSRALLDTIRYISGKGGILVTCDFIPGNKEIPVRMFWKASSTLLASRAEVSIKDRLFSPVRS